MIKVFYNKLTPEGIEISGEEPGKYLELENDDNILSISNIFYKIIVSIVNNGVLIRGKISAILTCTCAKCTDQFDYELLNKDICHFFEIPNKTEIDLTEQLREDILINLPQIYLCSDNCKGICVVCGQNLNKNKCSCQVHEEEENIWKKLENIDL